VPEEDPELPVIADAVEASLVLGWSVVFVAGVVVAAFLSPVFYIITVAGVVADWLRR
jgi:hypothetical protein